MVQRPCPDLRVGCAAMSIPTATAGGAGQPASLPRSRASAAREGPLEPGLVVDLGQRRSEGEGARGREGRGRGCGDWWRAERGWDAGAGRVAHAEVRRPRSRTMRRGHQPLRVTVSRRVIASGGSGAYCRDAKLRQWYGDGHRTWECEGGLGSERCGACGGGSRIVAIGPTAPARPVYGAVPEPWRHRSQGAFR